MAKAKKFNKKKLTKIFFEYGLHLWLIVFVMNVAIFYAINFYSFGKGCLTPQQVQSDNRCLYILNGKVYEKGTRSNPHQGHPCGSDVTSVVPPSHTGNPGMYLLPNYVSDICSSQPQPTSPPKPTTPPKPTNIPTAKPAPTNAPAPTRMAATIAVPKATDTPTLPPKVIAATPLPTIAIATPTVMVTRVISQPYTAIPTGAPTPTLSPLVGPGIKFSFAMPAIGIGPGETTPVHPTRNVTLNIYDASIPLTNLKVPPTYTASTSATYDANSSSQTAGQFVVQGADLGATVPAGTYYIAFRTNQIPLTLIKTTETEVAGTMFHATPGTIAAETPQVTNVAVGDFNGDDVVDIQDYSIFVDCYGSKVTSPSCLAPEAVDLNDNGSVDGIDYNLLLKSIRTAPGNVAKVQPSVGVPQTSTSAGQPIISSTPTLSLAKKLPSPALRFVTHHPTLLPPSPTVTPSKSMFAAASILTLSKVLSYLAFIILLAVAILGAYKSRFLNSLFHRGENTKPVTPPTQPSAPVASPEQSVAPPVAQTVAPEPAPPAEKKQISKVYYITGGSTAAVNGRTTLTLTDEEGARVGYTSQTMLPDGYYSVSGYEEVVDGVMSVNILTLTPALKPGTNL